MPEFPKSVPAYLDEPCPKCGIAIGLHPYTGIVLLELPDLRAFELICPPKNRPHGPRLTLHHRTH